ncbi:antibiotic biosynthesis monooxygenase family protein [Nesterenkonia alba]|uniref:antibiotic biosynthesis monooxygenase family protein n=1 Tax=Nesterenkonia alba TaxID=515814 RepID=UPI0003B55FF4|nr:hypothetical protein [Nesterenkonia alba]
MFRTVLRFTPNPEDIPQIEAIFAAGDVLGYSLEQTRAISSELCVSVDGGEAEIIVTATWPDAKAYQEWLDHPRRGTVAAGLPELVGEPGAARLFKVKQRASRVDENVVREEI